MQGITEPLDFKYSASLNLPKKSKWKCWLFGSYPGPNGMIYHPDEGKEPNIFVRFMMNLCLGCKWVKNE